MRLTIGITSLLGVAVAGASQGLGIMPGMYLVEFADGHDNASFFTSMRASGLSPTPRMSLDFKLFQGASFHLNDSVPHEHRQKVSMISAMPAVKQMWPLRMYPVPSVPRRNVMANPNGTITRLDDSSLTNEDAAQKKDAFSTHVMTQVDRLHAEGNTGQGMRIGIVDTGVDYTHPALGGCFGKKCLISYGYDLVGDTWDGYDAPKPDGDPFDKCIGHGTHVSGIIAAQPNELNFTGVAPGATLGMYKVFSCETLGTSDDVLIAAFNMAFEDGSDIITASIGGNIGWSEVPWSVAVSRIVDAGVPCTIAAGNAGMAGLFTASNAADGEGVTAVASFDNAVTPHLLPKAFFTQSEMGSQSSDGTNPNAPSAFAWMPSYPAFRNITLPLISLSNDSNVTSDACKALPASTVDLSDYAVLIRLGGCDPRVKAINALGKNAANIVFYASDNSALSEYFLEGSPTDALNGSGTVTAAQGAAWIKSLNSGLDIRVTFIDPRHAEMAYMEMPNDLTGGFASYFTSWGPTWDLSVYPTVGAPGGNILSTYPLSKGGYAVDSGTSMATPFTAGVYALVSQTRNKSLTPSQLANLVSSTAKANFWNDGSGTLRDLAPVPQQGPGLIQAYDAAYATTLLSKSSISFNDSLHTPSSVEFVISNDGADTITYELGNMPALGMYMMSEDQSSLSPTPAYFPNPIFAASAGINFSESTVNLRPGARAIVSVSAQPPSTLNDHLLPVYSGYISINGSDGSNLTIPYLGVAGSMYQASNLNKLSSSNIGCGGSYQYQESYCYYDNASFTLPYPTEQVSASGYYLDCYYVYPEVRIDLNLATANVRVDVIPLSHNYSGPIVTVLNKKTAGTLDGFPLAYSDRDFLSGWFNGMLADGTVVPEGKYGLLVRVLRLFGDPELADDYESLEVYPFALHYGNASSRSGGFPPARKGMPLIH